MKRLMIAMAAAAMLAGCGDGNEKKAAKKAVGTNAVVQTYADMPVEAVLVTVNGKSLTKLDVETDLTLQLSLLRMRMPKITGERIKREQDRMIRKAFDGFALRRVMMDEAEKRGIVATADEIEAVHTNFMATAFRGKKMTYAEMRGNLRPAMAKKIDADLAADAVVFKLQRQMAEETAYKPTDAEVADKLAKIKDYNKRTHALEVKTWQSATNVWKQIVSGEPFERAAERMKSKEEHITYEPEWGSFTLDYFNDSPALQACIRAMKPGMVTPPVPADNGVVLIKLIEIVEPTTPNAGVRYNLGQLHFALPEYYSDYTAETLKAAMIKEKSNIQLKAKIDGLVKAAQVAYPSGTAKQIFAKNKKKEHAKSERNETK